jgi:imidazolonepropionase-like amidohydrolase
MPDQGRVVFQGAVVFDGTGAAPAGTDIAVEHGRVAEVGTGLAGDRVVPLAGHGVLPGFVDCHVHVMATTTDIAALAMTSPTYRLAQAVVNLRRTLAAGITTARDADGADAGLRQAVADGLIAGPRLRVAVSMLSQTGGRGDYHLPAGFALPAFDVHNNRPDGIADGPLEVRAMARRIIRAGADVLKLALNGSALNGGDLGMHFRDDEIAEAVAEADAAGIPVMAHAHSAAAIAAAVRHGVRSVEHGTNLDEPTAALMAELGIWLVPTVAAGRAALAAALADGRASDHLELFVEHQAATVRLARAAGVRIAFGSDSGVLPHGANLHELAELVRCGLTDVEALVAATSSAAELLGLDDEVGTIAPGRRADLVVVSGSPTDVSTLPSRITAVVKDGRLVAGRLP